MNQDRSRALFDRALDVLPGGVNSPVRATRPYPAFIDHGDGGHVVDADGNRYVDHVMGYGPLLLGHDLPEPVMAAVQSAASDGPMYGAPCEAEVELAEFVTRHVPSVDRLRFVNSGTEATVSALRLARAHTGRDDVVVVQGGYHGAQESTLVEGDVTGTAPSSPGIPQAFAEHTIPVPFNDASALQSAFEASGSHGGGPAAGSSGPGAGDTDVAAVIVEPILGNNGIVHPTDGYLDRVRELCTEHGALLIFDEVITGFRVGGLGCAQSKFDVTPDLTTFGKIVGGGFPVGAIGGRGPIVDQFTPSGEVFQAGTFSGHPVTMAAGLATLEYAAEHDVYDHLADLGDQLRSGLTDVVADRAPEYTVVGSDSMFKVIFTGEGPRDLEGQCEAGCRQDPSCPRYEYCPKDGADVDAAAGERWERLFRPAMLEEGVMLTGNQNESQFLCYQHTAADVETTLEAYKAAL